MTQPTDPLAPSADPTTSSPATAVSSRKAMQAQNATHPPLPNPSRASA